MIEAEVEPSAFSIEEDIEPKANAAERTIRDIYREHYPAILRWVNRDEGFVNARQGFIDEEAARRACNDAIRTVYFHRAEKDAVLQGLANTLIPKYRQEIFAESYDALIKRIDRINQPQPERVTHERRLYAFFKEYAPEILSGEASYIRFKAPGFMPLTIECLYGNRLSIMHHHTQHGDMMRDPDMEFELDHKQETANAHYFRQDDIPHVEQEVVRYVDDEAHINHRLERDLNSYAMDWFRNIRAQGYEREYMDIEHDTLYFRANYAENNIVCSIVNNDYPTLNPAIRAYARSKGIEYSIGMGHLGNGVTVWNSLKEENGDYQQLAHISLSREVQFRVTDLPAEIRAYIERQAQTMELNISATQDIAVFDTPPSHIDA